MTNSYLDSHLGVMATMAMSKNMASGQNTVHVSNLHPQIEYICFEFPRNLEINFLSKVYACR